jgi:hypothetical protein
MEKIPTLFIRDPTNMKLVTRNVNHDAAWVLEGRGYPTVKKDGTNVRVTVENGLCTFVEKRRNPTREEKAMGAEPGYVDAHPNDPADKHIFAAVDATNFTDWPDGAWPCEALGPKIQGGVESDVPILYPFTLHPMSVLGDPRTWNELKTFFAQFYVEGIVWHRTDGSMAKIKRRDFGLEWPAKKGN